EPAATPAPVAVATRSDTRPLAAVHPLPTAGDDAPTVHGLTTFPAGVVDTRTARVRLAGVPTPDAPSGARERRGDPRDVQMLGARHEARHQAARTDVDGLHDMMRQLLAAGGSDLHLSVGVAPTMRVHGDLRRLADHGPLGGPEIEALLRTIVDGGQWHTFEQTHELDLAYTAPAIGRFRVNLYRQRGVCGAAFRAIPTVIPELETLGLPPQIEQFAGLPRGLVLVTGPTGSGKTTTLASLLALANRTRSPHIVTIEDPIEFLHDHGTGLVNQREVGGDTASFAAALKHALRQDPDVILVGELRDLETTATALTAAETGHLVFATLHTQSAAQTVDRVIDVFPAHQQGEVRAQLASTLRGVVTQALAPRADGAGRAVVAEVMVATPAIRNLIREGKTHQIPSFMQAGGRDGMLSFDQHLASLVRSGVIAFDRALTLCHSSEDFGRLARTVSA
ncbi:type IV pilus twitching motility protein PilT, partial [Jatrophihabitans sp. YIM 134969]